MKGWPRANLLDGPFEHIPLKKHRANTRVLMISAAFPPMAAGEADHTLHLCRHLADSGAEVHLLTSADHAGASESFDVHPVMRDWSWGDFPRLARFIKRCSPDAILLMYSSWIYNYHPLI